MGSKKQLCRPNYLFCGCLRADLASHYTAVLLFSNVVRAQSLWFIASSISTHHIRPYARHVACQRPERHS
eukprot:scaffold212074_cov35-Prasinocladus_malaysianus.AAC.1